MLLLNKEVCPPGWGDVHKTSELTLSETRNIFENMEA